MLVLILRYTKGELCACPRVLYTYSAVARESLLPLLEIPLALYVLTAQCFGWHVCCSCHHRARLALLGVAVPCSEVSVVVR